MKGELVARFESLMTDFLDLSLGLFPFLLIASALYVSGTFIVRSLAETGGRKLVLSTAWIGTPVHESSHLLACLFFRHRIREVRFFRPDPVTGVLGYVSHEWRKGAFWQELGHLFIAVAPLPGGAFVLWILGEVLMPGMAAPDLSSVFKNASFSDWLPLSAEMFRDWAGGFLHRDVLTDYRTWLFVYLALCVSAFLGPSPKDFSNAWKGLHRPLILLVVLMTLPRLLFDVSLFPPAFYSGFLPTCYGLLGSAVFFSVMGSLISFLLWTTSNALRKSLSKNA